MIERVLIKTLRAGIAARLAAPQRIVDMCVDNYGLTQSEAEAVRDTIVAEPPSVALQYPREDSTFPLIAVILTEEVEDTQYLNAGHTRFLGARQVRGSVWQQSFAIWVCSKHPDLTLYLYAMAKDIMLTSRDDIVASGVVVSSMSGSDMGPNADYAPYWLFIRQLSLQATQQQEAFEAPQRLIRAVEGATARERPLPTAPLDGDAPGRISPYPDPFAPSIG